MCGIMKNNRIGNSRAVGSLPLGKGVVPVSVFEALMFAVTFTSLIVLILTSNHKK